VSLLRNIRVVLYEPQDPVNIGGTVRVMKNMGLDDLVLVRPMRYDPDKLERIAHNTRDLAGRIRHVDELGDALQDCVAVYAFAGKQRAVRWPVVTPRDMAGLALERAVDGPVAMLFGREDHGLPNEALDQSTAVVCIPTTEHMSLNLAQAILVGAYELHLAAGDVTRTRNPEHVMRAVRSLLSRAEPATREMDLVKSMAIEVERTLERETRRSFKAALNGAMYEPPESDIPGIPPGGTGDAPVVQGSDADATRLTNDV
jgi:TrmH family RNA methyltransferase